MNKSDKNVFLSVIIPAYNEEKYILETINHSIEILNKANVSYEIIVVNNNSTDDTEKIVKKLDVKVLFQSERSIAKARNMGAFEAKGKYLLFIDADTKITTTLLNKSLEKIKSIKALSSISKFEKYPTVSSYGIWLYNIASKLLKLGVGQYIFIEKLSFESINGFDESYFAFEEIDLFKRLIGKYGKDSFEVLFSPVITSSRKFDKGKKNTNKFLLLLLRSFFDNSVGKNKDELDFWYSNEIYDNRNKYKLYILIAVCILFFFGNVVTKYNLSLLDYSFLITPIIFLLILPIFIDRKINLKIFIITFMVTFALEVFGSKTSLPFGRYEYTSIYSLVGILGVPFFISFAWYILLTTISKVTSNRLLTTVFIVILDIFLEFFAVKNGIWKWDNTPTNFFLIAPILNYISWGIISFLLYPTIRKQKLSLFYSTSILVVIIGYISTSLLLMNESIGYLGFFLNLVLVLIALRNKNSKYNNKDAISLG